MKNSGDLTKRMIAEHIESWLLNRGYKIKPCKPLTYTQIVYVTWEMFGFVVDKDTVSKHYYECLSQPEIPYGRGFYRKRPRPGNRYRPFGNKFASKKKI